MAWAPPFIQDYFVCPKLLLETNLSSLTTKNNPVLEGIHLPTHDKPGRTGFLLIAIALGALVKPKRSSSGAEARQLLTYSDRGEFTDEPKNGQEPQDHANDYDSIQDHLNGARHWDVCVDEVENNPHYDQDYHHVD
jgi:hypothetical protein